MAQRIVLVDDLDGTDAAETVPFGIDGVTYEIDLSSTNAALLRDLLARYVAAGRQVSGHRVRASSAPAHRSTTPSTGNRERNRAIRAWAADNGIQISLRGRIPTSVFAAYAARGQKPPAPPAEPPAATSRDSSAGSRARPSTPRKPVAPASSTSAAPAASRVRNDEIRRWAAEHGYEVALRGRIPAAVVAAYYARDAQPVETTKRARGAAPKKVAAATRTQPRKKIARRS